MKYIPLNLPLLANPVNWLIVFSIAALWTAIFYAIASFAKAANTPSAIA
jgi:hypothetical protein